MRVIHVLRKPLSEGTVAANTLKHGTGGLNIDASRISTTDNLNGGAYAEDPTHRAGEDMWTRDRKGDTNCFRRGKEHAGEYRQPKGRWPANVILQHLDGCLCVGVKKVKGITGGTKPHRQAAPITVHGGFAEKQNRPYFNHTDQDGKETVADWACGPGCPVARLDADSLAGGMHSAGSNRSAKRGAGKTGMFPMDGDGHRFGDRGGASRFYKQIGGKKDA